MLLPRMAALAEVAWDSARDERVFEFLEPGEVVDSTLRGFRL